MSTKKYTSKSTNKELKAIIDKLESAIWSLEQELERYKQKTLGNKVKQEPIVEEEDYKTLYLKLKKRFK